MKKIFVIYTEKDPEINRTRLLTIKKLLEDDCNYVFIDRLDNNSISHQEKWFKELVAADEIVLLNSPFLKKSKWVRQELRIAKLLGKKVRMMDIKYIDRISRL